MESYDAPAFCTAKITNVENTACELDFNVTPVSEEHLPKVTNEEVEQVANNGLYASDSKDYLVVHEDDDGVIVIED